MWISFDGHLIKTCFFKHKTLIINVFSFDGHLIVIHRLTTIILKVLKNQYTPYVIGSKYSKPRALFHCGIFLLLGF